MTSESSVSQIYLSQRLRVTCHNVGRQQMVVTFDNWRKSRRGFPQTAGSAFFETAGMTQLVLHTARND